MIVSRSFWPGLCTSGGLVPVPRLLTSRTLCLRLLRAQTYGLQVLDYARLVVLGQLFGA